MFKCFVFWSTQKRQTSRSEYVYFQVYKFYQIYYFCVAYNIKYFVIKFYTLVGYIFNYVQIYFHNFLKTINMILIFLNDQDHWSPGAKNTFRSVLLDHLMFKLYHNYSGCFTT
jgi:hypothetical protein